MKKDKQSLYLFGIVSVVALIGIGLVSFSSSQDVAGNAFNRGSNFGNFDQKNFDTSWVSQMRQGMQQADWQGNMQNFNGQWGGNGNVMTLRSQLGGDFSPGTVRQIVQLAQTDPAAAQAEVTRLCGEASAKYSELNNGGLEELKAQFRQRAMDAEQRYEGMYNDYCVNRNLGRLQGNAEFLAQDSNLGQYEQQLDQMCAQARDNAAKLKSQFSDESVNAMIESYKKKYQDMKAQWCDNPNAVYDFIDQMMGRMSNRMNSDYGNRMGSNRIGNNRNGRKGSGRNSGNPGGNTIVCTEIYDPVCGVDGKTYSNSCYAMKAGVSVQYDGVCGSGGSPSYEPPSDPYVRPPTNAIE